MSLALQHITNILETNGLSEQCPGLLYGRMGIAIFFFHLSRHTQNNRYESYAFQLIDSVQKNLHTNSPVDYARGLSGIGCGIEYLAQQGFIENYTDEILEDIDSKIFQAIVCTEYIDIDTYNSILGLGRYLMLRVSNPMANNENIRTLTNRTLLIHVIDKLEQLLVDKGESTKEANHFLEEVSRLHVYPTKVKKLISKYCYQEEVFLSIQPTGTLLESETINFGLHNGYAGYGLHLLSEQNVKNQTWRVLL